MPCLKPARTPLLARAEVRLAIARALRRQRVPAVHVEALTHQVLESLAHRPPLQSLSGCVAVARRAATRLAVDRMRRARTRAGVVASPKETPDVGPAARPAPGPLAESPGAMAESQAEEIPRPSIAQRPGAAKAAKETARSDWPRARSGVRESWAASATVAFATLIGVIASVAWDREPPPAPHHERVVTSTEPTSEQRAESLRLQALRGCELEQWADCLQDLERAAELDPAGDAKPEVQKARQQARSHIEEKR